MTDITTMSGTQAIAALSRELSFAIARAQAAEARVAELEDELGRLRSQLADRRWRTSSEELPGDGEVEIRATGRYDDELGLDIYIGALLTCSLPYGVPGIQWRPMDRDDVTEASFRRSWKEVQEGKIRPVAELWGGIDEEE